MSGEGEKSFLGLNKKQLDALDKAMEKSNRSKINGAIEYPIEITNAKINGRFYESRHFGGRTNVGDPVAIRPVKSIDPEEKTYLGFYMGEIPYTGNFFYDPKDKDLTVLINNNPGIFVPALKRIVFGYQSWWGPIKDEKHLREITDDTIKDIWYVRAYEEISKKIAESQKPTDKEGTA